MRDLLLVLIVLAILPMAFMRPMVGLWLWMGFSYMNPHRLTWGFASGLPWVMLVACITIVSLLINRDQRQAIPWRVLTMLMALFLVWTAISSITAASGDYAWIRWQDLLKMIALAFATLALVTDTTRLHRVLWAIVLSFGFWGAKGGLFTIMSGGGYHVMGPIGSFFRDNNQFALVMCMTLPLMRYLQLYTSNRWLHRGLWLLILLTVVSVLGTYSRGGFLGLGVVGLLLLVKSRHRVALALVGLLLVMSASTIVPQKWFDRMSSIQSYEQEGSAQSRFNSWRFATRVALANPLTGGGFGVAGNRSMWARYSPGDKVRAIHSIYFQVLGEQGFAGLFLYLAMIALAWNSLRRTKKLARAGPEHRWMSDLAAMIQVSFAGYLAAGAFLPMPYFELLYQLLAIVVLLRVLQQRALGQTARGGGLAKETPAGESPIMAAPVPAQSSAPETGVKDLPKW